MPMDVSVDSVSRVVTTRAWGDISEDDLAALRRAYETNPDIDPSFVRLCDLSAATGISVSAGTMARWAADPIANPAVRHAIVCSAPKVLRSVLEYVAKSRSYFREVSVFPTHRAAAEWIGAQQPVH